LIREKKYLTVNHQKMEFPVHNNPDQQQFEVEAEGELAILQYRFHDKLLWLMHTEVPKKLEGHGIASILAHNALEWARATNIKVKVICPFVAVYLKRHPEYNDIVES
jgi:predicted GNAT family acetyltransferase